MIGRERPAATAMLACAALLAGCPGEPSLVGDADEVDADIDSDAADDSRVDDSGMPEDGLETLPLPGVCGDGRVDPGEECDDGNRMNDDECDWECRTGAGSFVYPDPDPSIPEVITDGDASTVALDDAGSVVCNEWWNGIQVAWLDGVYGLAYQVTSPYIATRFRILDGAGAPTAGPWERIEAWAAPTIRLVPFAGEFLLFGSQDTAGLYLTRLDATAEAVAPDVHVREPPDGTGPYRLLDAACAGDRCVVAGYIGPGILVLDAVSPTGELLGPPALIPGDDPLANPQGVFALPDGWAVANDAGVLVLDPSLSVIHWSGILSRHIGWPSLVGRPVVAATDELLLYAWIGLAAVPGEAGDLWTSGVDFDGSLAWPPRVTVAACASGHQVPAAAAGPAGVLVAWVYPSGSGTGGTCEVRALNTDRWGNPRSAPLVAVPPEACGSGDEWTIAAIVGDDTGYGLFTVIEENPVGCRLVFRHFVPGAAAGGP